MKCSLCEAPMMEGSAKCSQCGKWHLGAASTSRSRKRLSDVQSSVVERIATKGVGSVATNGGWPRGCVTMLGGEPGTGKSTLSLHISAVVASTLYISAEESENDVRARAERLSIPGLLERVEIYDALGGNEWIDAALESGPPCELVVLDSLPGMVGIGNDAGGMEVLRALKRHVTKNRSHAIVIDHATKDDFFAGRLALQHDVDTTLVMYAEGKEERVLVSVKNRHGPSGAKEELILSERGFRVVPPPKKKGQRK